MHPYMDNDSAFKQQPLTMEMLLAEPPPYKMDVEELLIEQRGIREVFIKYINKNAFLFSSPSQGWTKAAVESA